MSTAKPFIFEKPIDPDAVTLRRFLEMRAEAHIASGKAKTDAIGNTIRNNPAFADLLDKPLIKFLDAGFEHHTSNPLFMASDAAVENAQKKVAAGKKDIDPDAVNPRRTLYSHVNAIEQNILFQLNLPDNRELKKRYDNSGISLMTDGVVNPEKPGPLSERFRFRHENVGYLKKALLEHLTENPQDEHIVRALFMEIDLGFRPGEVERMPLSAFHPAAATTGRFKGTTVPGLYILPDATKMGQEINIPMSPDIFAQFKAGMLRHKKIVGEGGVDALFIDNDGNPIKEGDMTRVLKNIQVKAHNGTGLMFDIETGEEIFSLPRSYLLRNMQITAGASLGIDAITSGEMRGRAYRGPGAQEVGYKGVVPGQHRIDQAEPHSRVHAYFRALLTDALELGEEVIIAPDQDFIGAWMASGGDVNTLAASLATSDGIIPVTEQPTQNPNTPYTKDQLGQLTPRVIKTDIAEDTPPPDLEPEMSDDEKDDMFRRLMRGLVPKSVVVAAATSGEDAKNINKEDIGDIVTQLAIEEAMYFAGSKGLQMAGMGASFANPVSLFPQLALSSISPAGPDSDVVPLEEEVRAAELRAAESIRPGKSRKDTVDYTVAIGKAEGEREAQLIDMFMEPDMGEGSPQDIMERVVNADSMMQDIDQTPTFTDQTPSFMAR